MSGVHRLIVALLALALLLFAVLMVDELLAALHDADEYRDGRSLTRYLLETSLLLLVSLAGALGGSFYALGGERFTRGAWLTHGATALLVLWTLLHYLRS